MSKAILFDLDSTLYDARDFFAGVFHAIGEDLATRYGRCSNQLSESLMNCWKELTSRHPRLFNTFLDTEGLPAHEVATLIDALHRHRPELELYDDAAEFLARVPEGLGIGVVSDGHGMMQRNKVRALDLSRRFDPIVFTSDHGSGWHKPSPLPFRAACSYLGLEPQEVVYVGDNPYVDGGGPRALGMPAVRLRRGEFKDHEPPEADEFCAEIASLTELLAEGFLEEIHSQTLS